MRQERGQPGTKCLWSHRRSFWRDQTCELTHAEAMHKPDVLARSWFCQENLQETMQSPLKIVGGLSASINEAVKWVVMCRVGQHLALTRWVGLWAPQGKSSSRGIAKDGKEGKSEWLIGCWLLEMSTALKKSLLPKRYLPTHADETSREFMDSRLTSLNRTSHPSLTMSSARKNMQKKFSMTMKTGSALKSISLPIPHGSPKSPKRLAKLGQIGYSFLTSPQVVKLGKQH